MYTQRGKRFDFVAELRRVVRLEAMLACSYFPEFERNCGNSSKRSHSMYVTALVGRENIF